MGLPPHLRAFWIPRSSYLPNPQIVLSKNHVPSPVLGTGLFSEQTTKALAMGYCDGGDSDQGRKSWSCGRESGELAGKVKQRQGWGRVQWRGL